MYVYVNIYTVHGPVCIDGICVYVCVPMLMAVLSEKATAVQGTVVWSRQNPCQRMLLSVAFPL